jgi:predicted nucleic-acid-binding protein
VIAVDTNVVVRFLVGDNPAEAKRAAALFARNHISVPLTVLLETEWVLRRSYRFASERISSALDDLLGIPTVSCPQREAVRIALDAFARGCDFADALHAAAATRADAFATFDRAFVRRAGPLASLPPLRLVSSLVASARSPRVTRK